MFNMNAQKIEKLVWKSITIAAPLVKNAYVCDVSKDDFATNRITECSNFPMVHHITDATVVQINRPAGEHAESKVCFSGE